MSYIHSLRASKIVLRRYGTRWVRASSSAAIPEFAPPKIKAFRRSAAIPEELLKQSPMERQRINLSNHNRRAGDLSPQGKRLYAQIMSGALDVKKHLDACIEKQELPIETIRICLNAKHERLIGLDRDQRAKVLQAEDKQFIRSLMRYMLATPTRMAQLVHLINNDFNCAFRICYFAVAEGYQIAIENFIMMDIAHLFTEPMDPKTLILVRNQLLCALGQAHLALDAEGKADSALRCFFSMAGKIKELQLNPNLTHLDKVSYRRSFISLGNALSRGSYPRTDVELWDKFIAFYKAYMQPWKGHQGDHFKAGYNLTLALLKLDHPREPKYQDLLSLLKSDLIGASESEIETYRGQLPVSDNILGPHLKKAASLAAQDGRSDDSLWIDGLAPKLLGNFRGPDRRYRI